MNLRLINNFDFNAVLRVFIYFVTGCVSLILTCTLSSVLITFLLTIISVCLFALLFAHIGYTALPLSLIPVIFIALTESCNAALSLLSTIVLAGAIGILLKNKSRVSDTVLYSSIAYTLSIVMFTLIQLIIESGFQAPAKYVEILNKNLSALFNTIVKNYTDITGISVGNINVVIENVKALLPGTIISAFVICSCISYFATVTLSKLVRDDKVYCGKSMYDLKPSSVSAWIFMICSIISILLKPGQSDIHFYTHLTTNIVTVLTPVFVFAGIYYLANIKFKVERAKPGFTIFIFAISLLTGILYLIVFYLAFCGVTYTLKSSIADKIIKNNTDNE